jgi:hypothetical protein
VHSCLSERHFWEAFPCFFCVCTDAVVLNLLLTLCNMLLIYLVIVAIVVFPRSKCVAHVICCLYLGLGNLLTYVAFLYHVFG